MSEFDLELLRKTFEEETFSTLPRIEELIVPLGRLEHTTESLKELLIAIHTIKGNARIVELEHVAAFAKAFEDLLIDVRDETLAISPAALAGLLQRGCAALRSMVPEAVEGASTLSSDQQLLQQELMDAHAQV